MAACNGSEWRRRIIPSPPLPFISWDDLMGLALEEAAKAETSQEVPVGAVIVSEQGRIIGRGHNVPASQNDPSAHAEIQAVRAACRSIGNYRLDGCVLVVTLEPCLMCAGALVHARISGVVYGAEDPKAGAVDSCLDALDLPFHNHMVWHMGGVCREECRETLRRFFSVRREL